MRYLKEASSYFDSHVICLSDLYTNKNYFPAQMISYFGSVGRFNQVKILTSSHVWYRISIRSFYFIHIQCLTDFWVIQFSDYLSGIRT